MPNVRTVVRNIECVRTLSHVVFALVVGAVAVDGRFLLLVCSMPRNASIYRCGFIPHKIVEIVKY